MPTRFARHLLRSAPVLQQKTTPPLQPPREIRPFQVCFERARSVDFFTSPSRYPRNKRVSQAAIVVVVVGTDLFLYDKDRGTMTHGPQSKQIKILLLIHPTAYQNKLWSMRHMKSLKIWIKPSYLFLVNLTQNFNDIFLTGSSDR